MDVEKVRAEMAQMDERGCTRAEMEDRLSDEAMKTGGAWADVWTAYLNARDPAAWVERFVAG